VVPTGASTANNLTVVVTVNSEASVGTAFTVFNPPVSATNVTAGGYQPKLAMDARGSPHIVHLPTNSPAATLLYTSWNPATSTWTTITLENLARYSRPSIAIGTDGVIHIATASTPGIRYLTCNPAAVSCTVPGNWTAVTAIGNFGGGGCGTDPCMDFTSIALTSNNSPRVAYYEVSRISGNGCVNQVTECLKYASFGSPSWTDEVIDSVAEDPGGDRGAYASLAIDRANDQPHVAYLDRDATNLLYATKAGGLWGNVSPMQAAVGTHASIAVNSAGLPRIGHYRSSDNNVFVTTAVTSLAWNNQLASAAGPSAVTGGTSIQVGNDGNDRLAFYSQASSSIRLATRVAGVWSVDTTLPGSVGYVSMQLDAMNRARIAYQSSANQLGYYAQ
jgi:hypothetical protein